MLVHRERHIAREGHERQQCRGEDQRTQGDAGGCRLVRGLCTCGRRVNQAEQQRTHQVRRQRAHSAHSHHCGGRLNERRYGAVALLQEGRNRHTLERLQGNHNRRTGNGNRQDQGAQHDWLALRGTARLQHIRETHHQHRRGGRGQERPEDIDGQAARGHIGAGNPQAATRNGHERQDDPQTHRHDGCHLKAGKGRNHERSRKHEDETPGRFQTAHRREKVPAVLTGGHTAHSRLQGVEEHAHRHNGHAHRRRMRNLLARPQRGAHQHQRTSDSTQSRGHRNHASTLRRGTISRCSPAGCSPVSYSTGACRTHRARNLRLNTRDNTRHREKRRPEQQELRQLRTIQGALSNHGHHQRGDRRQQGRTQKRQGLVAGDRARRLGLLRGVFLHPALIGVLYRLAHRVLLIPSRQYSRQHKPSLHTQMRRTSTAGCTTHRTQI